jgi:hypothetical protein
MISRFLLILFGRGKPSPPLSPRCPWCRAEVVQKGRKICRWCGYRLERDTMYEGEWNDYMERKVPVTVKFQEGLWAVTVDEDPEFWLDAFNTLDDARKFCREHGLPHAMET